MRELTFLENVPLAPYTTFEIGGPARWLAEAQCEQHVVEAVAFARNRQLPLFVLGGGSNLLVSDDGFDGVVLRMAIRGIAQCTGESDGRFSVGAGESWDAFVTYATERDCGGIECLAGIPGTVGGTPIQNVGAYGQEVSTTIGGVRVFDVEKSAFGELASEDCGFGYRTSIFNTSARGRYIVTGVDFALVPSGQPLLAYQDLNLHFKGWMSPPTLAQTAAAVREIRDNKGMLLAPGKSAVHSAGSFFKNPIVSDDGIARIAVAAGIAHEVVPRYAAGDGRHKVPAAWLLEKAGFHKGFALGRAALSSRHTLALTNRGGATAAEIVALRDVIVGRVEELFGVRLEPEPVMLGNLQDQGKSLP